MITLQFVQGTDVAARLIEWFSHGCRFSHVDTVMPDGRLLGARSDQTGGAPAGVQIREANYIGDEAALRIALDLTGDQQETYYRFLRAQIGKPYDKTAIVSFVTGRNWQEDDAWFCSELEAAALQSCGFFKYRLATPSNKITPPDLILLLSAATPVALS